MYRYAVRGLNAPSRNNHRIAIFSFPQLSTRYFNCTTIVHFLCRHFVIGKFKYTSYRPREGQRRGEVVSQYIKLFAFIITQHNHPHIHDLIPTRQSQERESLCGEPERVFPMSSPYILDQIGIIYIRISIPLYGINRIVPRQLSFARRVLRMPLQQHVQRPLFPYRISIVIEHRRLPIVTQVFIGRYDIEIGTSKVALILVGRFEATVGIIYSPTILSYLRDPIVKARNSRDLTQRQIVFSGIGRSVCREQMMQIPISIIFISAPPTFRERVLYMHAPDSIKAIEIAYFIGIPVPHTAIFFTVCSGEALPRGIFPTTITECMHRTYYFV